MRCLQEYSHILCDAIADDAYASMVAGASVAAVNWLAVSCLIVYAMRVGLAIALCCSSAGRDVVL